MYSQIMLLFVMLIGTSSGYLKIYPVNEEVVSEKVMQKTASIEPVTFTMKGIIRYNKPAHADIPGPLKIFFGGYGDEIHEFNGTIQWDDMKISYQSEDEPRLLFQSSDHYYLLGQFYENKDYVALYTVDLTKKEWVELTDYDLISSFAELNIIDAKLKRVYSLWQIKKAIEHKQVKDAFDLFHREVVKNPRVFYGERYDEKGNLLSSKEEGSGAFIGCLENLATMAKDANEVSLKTTYWDDVINVLNHSQPKVDPQEIQFLCYALFVMDPIKSKGIVFEFFEKAGKDALPYDGRCYSKDWILSWWEQKK